MTDNDKAQKAAESSEFPTMGYCGPKQFDSLNKLLDQAKAEPSVNLNKIAKGKVELVDDTVDPHLQTR